MAALQLVELTATQAVEAFARRGCPANALATDADRIGRACHEMSVRFERGGRLVAFGDAGSGCDAAHVAVEFVHPVIVGKRALPALVLPGPDLVTQVGLLADSDDIALGISTGPPLGRVADALRTARAAGLLTIGLFGAAVAGEAVPGADVPGTDADVAEHLFVADSADPLIVKEIQVTTYHLLWELVHVFAEWSDRSGVSR